MTGLPSICFWLSLIIIGILPSRNQAAVQQIHKLTDPAGFETTYAYDGGKLVMKCEGSASEQTFLKVTPHDDNVSTDPKESTENTFELKPGSAGATYQCDKTTSHAIKLGALHCNPFSLIPEVRTCDINEWCLMDENGRARCEQMDPKDCSNAYPPLKYVCEKGNRQSIGKQGLCQAQYKQSTVESVQAATDCQQFTNLLLFKFGPTEAYNEVVLLPSSKQEWSIESTLFDPFECQVADNKSTSLATFQLTGGTNVAHKISFTSLPVKLQLNCGNKLASTVDQIMVSRFLIIYDEDVSKYKVTIKKSIKLETVSMSCSCDVPEGFLCGTTWHDPMETAPSRIHPDGSRGNRDLWKFSIDKPTRPLLSVAHERVIKYWEYPEPRNYTCYMQVFAFNYPNTFNLIKVPIVKDYIQAPVTITPEDFLKNKPDLKNEDVTKEITGTIEKKHAEIQAQAKAADDVAAKISDKSTITVGLLAFCLVIVVICLVFTIILCACAVVISRHLRENKDQLDSIMSSLKIKRTVSRTGSMVEQSKKNSTYVDSNLSVAKQAGKSVDKSKVRSSIGKSGPKAPKQQRKKSSIAK